MEAYFLEKVPERLGAGLVVALTPEAAFDLDKVDRAYSVPTDYAWPDECNLEADLMREIDRLGDFGPPMSIILGERWRSRTYRKKFLNAFVAKHPVKRITYIGEDNELACLVEGYNERKNQECG